MSSSNITVSAIDRRFFGGFLPGNASGSECRRLDGPGDHVSQDFAVVEREE